MSLPKGAAILLPRCTRAPAPLRKDGTCRWTIRFRAGVQAQADRFAAEGRRVIAAAYKPADSGSSPRGGAHFLGLAALTDPPRPDAAGRYGSACQRISVR